MFKSCKPIKNRQKLQESHQIQNGVWPGASTGYESHCYFIISYDQKYIIMVPMGTNKKT